MAPPKKTGINSLIGKKVVIFDDDFGKNLVGPFLLKSIDPGWLGIERDGTVVYMNSLAVGGIKEHQEIP